MIGWMGGSRRTSAASRTRSCYAKHWIEFGYGRPAADEDDALRQRLAEQSIGEQGDLHALIGALVETRAFLALSLEEGP